jgi:hypothetical protein
VDRLSPQVPLTTEFLHRDELAAKYLRDVEKLPAVFLHSGGELQSLIAADEINRTSNLQAFIALVRERATVRGLI